MIDYALFSKAKHLKEEGLTPPQIAQALSIDPRTVRKWLSRERFRPRKPSFRQSKLDPFKNDIVRMLEAHPYSAAQVFQRIRSEGFGGRYTIVKKYVRKIRPNRSPAFLKLAFAPGECAQVDWGSFGFVPVGETLRRLSFFVMLLCYSRMMYLEFFVSQSMAHFLAAHQNAFDFFGSVPGKIMIDNLKTAVLKHCFGQPPVFNPKYLEFANHYGFTISACNLGKANEKGRVENAIGYVKKNFLAGLNIPSFSAINPAARQWLDTIANVRVHGETRKQPSVLFEEERPFLSPLPANSFDIATVSQVRASSQFRISFDSNRYSVPAEYAGASLTLKTYPDRICLYSEEKLIARHPRSYERHQDFEDPDHPRELLLQRKKAGDQKLFMRFLALSPRAERYYQKLEHRRLNPHHHVRKIVALSEIHGAQAVSRAMEDAFSFEAFSCEYIANLLEQRSRCLPEPGALHLTRREDLLDIEVAQPDLSIYQHEGGRHER